MKIKTLLSIIFCVIAFIAVYIYFHPWDFSNQYKTYQDAVKAHEVEKGWIPPLVPTDAYNIKEAHDLSPVEEIYLEFNFSSGIYMLNQINQYKISDISSKEADIQPKAEANDKLAYYKVFCTYGRCFLAVNWTKQKAYYVQNWQHDPNLWWIRFKIFLKGTP